VTTQKQPNSPDVQTTEAGETLCEIAEAPAIAAADLPLIDWGPTQISLGKILRRLGTAWKLRRERYQQRRQLMQMDDRQLKDIGITREEAEQEARKPIWKD
jgi:uncharacterized protein YjiS (DUF1127 family)